MQRPEQFGPYELIERVATGGMAEIYLARTGKASQSVAGFEKFLALKMIRDNYSGDTEFVDMLINEAKIAVRLHHKNVVQVFDLSRIDQRYFIAMEFIDGRDLQALLVETAKQDTYAPFEAAAFIVREACAGLHYAHTRQDESGRPLAIVHRDMSPQNILLSYGGEVKIADFGIAKAANRQGEETAVGVIKGKFCYMSPEQAWGDPLDNRTDVFSLGVVLYELLTGEMLYQENDQMRLLERVRRAKIEPPTTIRRDVPSELEAITMMALERDKKERFLSAAAMQQELTRYLARYAPQYGQSDLAQYLRKVFGIAASEFERKIASLSKQRETRPSFAAVPSASAARQQLESASTIDPQVRERMMDRADFIPSEGMSLVHDFAALRKQGAEGGPLPSQDRTRPIRFTAPDEEEAPAPRPADDDLDLAPTRAHSRAEIDRILRDGPPPQARASAPEDEDPTMLYDGKALREALADPNAPDPRLLHSPPLESWRENRLHEHSLVTAAPALPGPQQAPDGSWDPRSEAILLDSADLEVIESHDAPSNHPNEYRVDESFYRPQPSLTPRAFGDGRERDSRERDGRERDGRERDSRERGGLDENQVTDEIEHARTVNRQRRASQNLHPSRHGNPRSRLRNLQDPPSRAGSVVRQESYSMLWLLAGGLFLLGVLAVVLVVALG